MIAALYVNAAGAYAGLPDVDCWDVERDARKYEGPHAVVAHPPCQRWGRYWHGSPMNPHQFKLGDDAGCFAHAVASVRQFGGVLEHPADSHAWRAHGIPRPPRYVGWVPAERPDAYTCYVEQGHYGHISRKPTWLYAVGTTLPDLNWTRGGQRLDPDLVARIGYAKARRRGALSCVGGGGNPKDRDATPPMFRDILIEMARSVSGRSTNAHTYR